MNNRRIIHTSNFAGRGGLDIATNGHEVAGIWNEQQPNNRTATWLAFNSHLTMLPSIRK